MTIGALLLLPLILLLSPVIVPCWVAWRKIREECLRCGHIFSAYDSMPLVKESGWSALRRCPGCKKYYCTPFTGAVAVIPVTEEELRQWLDE